VTQDDAKRLCELHLAFEQQGPDALTEAQSRLAHLISALQPVMDELQGDGGVVFVKTSSRSFLNNLRSYIQIGQGHANRRIPTQDAL